MLVLSIRTENPTAELGLYEDFKQLDYITWEAHRQLAETIHIQIDQLLSNHKISVQDLKGIIMFEGPGSFTGLRLGLATGNALAFALSIPTTGGQGEDWQTDALKKLQQQQGVAFTLPHYGAPVHITKQKK